MKLFEKISTSLSIFMIFLICYFNGLANGVSFTGLSVLIALCMLLNPVINLYKLNKNIIDNKTYHFSVILFSLFTSVITIKSIFIYYQYYLVDNGNKATLYFFDYLLYMLVAVLIIHLVTFFIKKDVLETKKDNSRIIFVVISLSSFFPFLSDINSLIIATSVGLAVFSVVMIFKVNDLNTKSDLQKLYLALMILSILSNNFVALILIFNMYLQLDHFGLNI